MKQDFPDVYTAVGRGIIAVLIGIVFAILLSSFITWYQCSFVEGVC